MKKIIILFLVAGSLLTETSWAQIRKIPAAVTEAFKEKYPQASQVEWKDRLSVFTASFEMDGEKYEAHFNSKGEWQDTEHRIDKEKLPEAVQEGFEKSKYTDWTTNSIYEIEHPGEKVEYRIQVEKSDVQKKNLWFSSNGRLLKDKITL